MTNSGCEGLHGDWSHSEYYYRREERSKASNSKARQVKASKFSMKYPGVEHFVLSKYILGLL